MKILCVLLPHFPLRCEFYRRPAIKDRPVVVTCDTGSQKLVLDYSPGLDGLQCGMTLQQAISHQGDVELVHGDVPYYRAAFNEVLDRLEQKSPMVEGSEIGCAYIGLDGLHLIYPDDNELAVAVREVLPPEFPVQMGIAQGKFLAYLAALYTSPGSCRVLAGDVTAFLKDLPCAVLPVSEKSKGRLKDYGIHTLGQATTLPTGPLQAQFGLEGKQIWELARGFDATPLRPRFMEETIEENVTLSSVTVSVDALLVAIESLLTRAFAGDRLRGRGIRSLTVWTRTWNAAHWERHINFKEPAIDIKSAMPRIRQCLEHYPQPGPVEQAGIKLTRLGNGPSRQKNLFPEVRAKDHLLEDIKQLELRLDSPQVYRVKEVEPWSRIPERRYALTPLNQ